MSVYFTYIWLSIVLHWNSNNQKLSSQYSQILSHRSRQLVTLTVGHMVKKRQWFCAKWRVFTTLTEQLQWILPWVRWKEICWITLGNLQSNWHLTHSMEQSPSGEANRLSASQVFPRTLCNPNVHYRIYKSPSYIPILNQINSVHAPQSNLLKIRLKVILPHEQCKFYSPIYVWVFQTVKLTTTCNKMITTIQIFHVNVSRTVMMLCSLIGG
jgi:hypothetical protein